MKTNLKLLFLICVILLAACQDESLTVEKQNAAIDEMKSILVASGVPEDKITIEDGRFLIDGDIAIDFASIPEIQKFLNGQANGRKDAYTYSSPYYATVQAVNNVKIYLDPSIGSTDWGTAFTQAVSSWNGIGCAISISFVSTAAQANISVNTYYNSNTSTIASSTVPLNGAINTTIMVNTYYNSLSASEKRNAITHEIGHSLGFAHSDGGSNYPTALIPGTTSVSNSNAVMYPTVHSWTGFISDEIIAAWKLYPRPVVSVSGPIKGWEGPYYTFGTSISNSTGAHTYSWEYSYDELNWVNSGKTTASITQQLPADFDLYLRVTVTNSLGIQGVGTHATMNLGPQ